jgi:uncharacterized membrane protein YhdT
MASSNDGQARQDLVVGLSTALTALSGKSDSTPSHPPISQSSLNPSKLPSPSTTILLPKLTNLTVIIVTLRLYTRAIILHNAGLDDWAILIALLFTLAYLACIYVLRANKMGFHGREATFEQATTTLKVSYGIEIVYYACVNAIKVSIVLFYLRIGKNYPLLPYSSSPCIRPSFGERENRKNVQTGNEKY